MSPTTTSRPGNSRPACATMFGDRSRAETETPRVARYAATCAGPQPSSTTRPSVSTEPAYSSRNARSNGFAPSSVAISSAYRCATWSYVSSVSSWLKLARSAGPCPASLTSLPLGAREALLGSVAHQLLDADPRTSCRNPSEQPPDRGVVDGRFSGGEEAASPPADVVRLREAGGPHDGST